MKEHTRKMVNVLGIDVSVMRPEKAVNITMNYLNRKEVSKIFFHTASSSLYCEEQKLAADFIDSCNLVLPGDQHMEYAVAHKTFSEEEQRGNGLFADAYLRRLLDRLNKDSHEIYAIMAKEDRFTSLKEYMSASFPQIVIKGQVFEETSEGEGARIVNEINACIPDIVFVCMPTELQIPFLEEYISMMNTKLIICIDSLQPLVITDREEFPHWVEALHLHPFYRWFKKEGKFQERLIASIFKKTVLDSSVSEKDEAENK